MKNSAAVQCRECGRTNGPLAALCLWCGAPMAGAPASTPPFEPAQAELDYVSGIGRLDDPAPVKLSVGEAGIEISETMPGTRRIVIDAASVIDARVSDEGRVSEGQSRQTWWRKLTESFLRSENKGRIRPAENRNYSLTIRYQEEGRLRAAVFHRRGSAGLLMIQGLARAVASLVGQRSQRAPRSG